MIWENENDVERNYFVAPLESRKHGCPLSMFKDLSLQVRNWAMFYFLKNQGWGFVLLYKKSRMNVYTKRKSSHFDSCL